MNEIWRETALGDALGYEIRGLDLARPRASGRCHQCRALQMGFSCRDRFKVGKWRIMPFGVTPLSVGPRRCFTIIISGF